MREHLDRIARIWQVAAFAGWIVLIAAMLAATASPSSAGAAAPAPELEQRRAEPQTNVDEVSRTVMCPSCDTTLDQSNSPAAQRMRVWVKAAVAAGWTKQEIRDGLVAEYGGDESILATPRAHGLGLLAWLVPAGVALVALIAGFVMVRRWRRAGDQTRSGSSA